uniref:tRNA-splicing endonuclease subunit Sen54 N-terminal domain-containing protein n=1 Tax=Parascaris univalens TaxID=6257 RepID=A0A915BHZ9_PARUN
EIPFNSNILEYAKREKVKMADRRRLFEYFVSVGLEEGAEDLSLSAQECGCRNTAPSAPITDICVIFPGLGETVPEGFECIESTPLGYPADLNHGSLRTPSVFVCFRRGYHKPPLVDIGVLDEGRGEKPMLDSNILLTTPFGRPANVNNASQGVYLTYRRAQPNSAPSQLVVTHICVILSNKGETPPHTYYKIPKNLNKGMVGSDVYMCYKKSQGSSKRLAYKPTVLDRFPADEEFPLAQNIPMFCLPMGALIECWPAKCQPPEKCFSTFVLTDQDGSKFYGACVTFYEQYKGKLSDEQLEKLDITPLPSARGTVDDSSSTNDPAEQMSFHSNISICIISRYPFFTAFKRFLFYIHRMSISGVHSVPIERYISHLMYEVSFPSPRCPRVLVQLGNETISLESHDDSQLPLSGAALFDTLKCLGADNLMYLMLLALLEQKILVHSLRPWLLTAVCESACALMFPFHWQCPYIPQCPLSLAGVLHAPLPFIAGVDSRYFDLYEDPPSDVTCFDLDTSTVSFSSVRQTLKLNILPKRASRQLKNNLERLHRRLYQEEFNVITLRKNMDFMPLDVDYQIQRKKRMLEVSVQDAFLKFMASVMHGYTAYLRPIRSAPRRVGATDTGSLFDLDAFLRSRDKSSIEFFKRFSETQSFNRFIEERSFVSDKNAYNAFFDDCIAKINPADERTFETSLLDVELSTSSQTEFTPPPEPMVDADGNEMHFQYEQFPRHLNPALFQLDTLIRTCKRGFDVNTERNSDGIGSALLRTKQETRNAVESAVHALEHSQLSWPKTLLFYAYSLWFMLLPSLLHVAKSKVKALKLAFQILDRIEQSGVPALDQVCYRILIQLCGDFGQPLLAVKVLQAMQRNGLEQNAVTYGIYHQAVLKASWPIGNRLTAVKAWNRLAIVVRAAAQFKMNLLITKRKHSLQNSDTASAMDSSSLNEKTVEGSESREVADGSIEDEELESAPFVISVHPLEPRIEEQNPQIVVEKETEDEAALDPLGALRATNDEHVNEQHKKELMSPSRARFIREHSASPFAHEVINSESANVKRNEKSTSWLKGLTNSPIVSKIMRSHTTDNFESSCDSADASLTISPSLSSLVTQVKKGYDDVILSSNFSSRLRDGVHSLVNEVRSLNRAYNKGATENGHLPGRDDNDELLFQEMLADEALFQLDSGAPCSLLPSEWWLSDQVHSPAHVPEGPVDVSISSASVCPNCRTVIYDEELMAGWAVDESNLNTSCVFCEFTFVPSLTVKIRARSTPLSSSWYFPSSFEAAVDSGTNSEEHLDDSPSDGVNTQLSVPFVSPLVLRRELENLLSSEYLSPINASLRHSHPIIFWNVVYYSRRLSLPTHLCSWIARCVHVRCVYDVPEMHTTCTPLYFANPSHHDGSLPTSDRPLAVWQHVIDSLQQSSVLRALQGLLTENRRVADGVKLRPHFPLFRDIQFTALDRFGSAVDREQLDVQYRVDFEHLPPRILSMLPVQDYPPRNVTRACRKIFLPLDLV